MCIQHAKHVSMMCFPCVKPRLPSPSSNANGQYAKLVIKQAPFIMLHQVFKGLQLL